MVNYFTSLTATGISWRIQI